MSVSFWTNVIIGQRVTLEDLYTPGKIGVVSCIHAPWGDVFCPTCGKKVKMGAIEREPTNLRRALDFGDVAFDAFEEGVVRSPLLKADRLQILDVAPHSDVPMDLVVGFLLARVDAAEYINEAGVTSLDPALIELRVREVAAWMERIGIKPDVHVFVVPKVSY